VAGRRRPSQNLASILQRRCVRALTLYRSEGYLCWGRVTLAATSSKIARLSNKPIPAGTRAREARTSLAPD
jgi:hypothetical protein